MLSVVVHDGSQLKKRVPAFSLLRVCSEHFTDVHLKMAKMIAFDFAPDIQ